MTLTGLVLGGQTLTCVDRGIWIENHKALVVSDLHLGALDDTNASMTATQLVTLAQLLKAERVVCVGDLFDHKASREMFELAPWLNSKLVGFEVILGNHDWEYVDRYTSSGIKTCELLELDSIVLSHFPLPKKTQIHGHLHPVTPDGKACFVIQTDRIGLPCFNVQLSRTRTIHPTDTQRLLEVVN